MEQTPLPLNNVPEFSVSELAFSLKKTVEQTYGHVRVRGELGRLTFHSSGHLYGNLKDEKAVIDMVCWRGTLSRLSIRPEEGLEVICTGKMSTYPARSNYQFIIESMELAGEGALLKMLEMRKKKLAAEGVFAPERKRAIPFLPRRIGVITSPTGAVIRDILHRIQDRFPMPVLLYPVRVQGDSAAEEIVRAIEYFNDLGALERPDTLILARGGGSLEDLMPFNEEAIIRMVADSSIPIITAVGHETDTTLVDYASDLRAPTPTGAAEMAVPVRVNLKAQVAEDGTRLSGAMDRVLDVRSQRLKGVRLPDPLSVIEMKAQGLDHAGFKLGSALDKMVSRLRERFGRVSGGLRSPQAVIEDKARMLRMRLDGFDDLLPRMLTDRAKMLSHSVRMLETLSFKSVLARGYALVRDEQGRAVSDADQIKAGQRMHIEFKDDKSVPVRAEGNALRGE